MGEPNVLDFTEQAAGSAPQDRRLSKNSVKIQEAAAIIKEIKVIEKVVAEKVDDADFVIDDDDSRIDLTECWEKSLYADTLYEALNIYQKTMQIFFRFPILLRRDPDDGSYVLKYKQCSLFPIAYVVTSILMLILTVLVSYNTIGILLDFPLKTQDNYTYVRTTTEGHKVTVVTKLQVRTQELYLLQKNIMAVIIIICLLVCSTVGNVNFFKKRHVIAAYYTFWLKAVELMKIDAAYNLVSWMRFCIFSYMGFLLLLIILQFIQLTPITAGAPAMTVILTYRLHTEDIHLSEQFWFYRNLFGLLLLYTFINSKCFIVLFIFTSKLITNCILVWNDRLHRVLNLGDRYRKRTEKCAERIGFDHLFKDYVCILDLIDGLDVVFANTLEAFYACHILSVIFELFYVYQSLTRSREFVRGRELDVIIMIIFVLQTIIFLWKASYSGSALSEKSLEGLDIIRRKGLLGRRSDEELYFVLSLYMSYTGHFDVGINASKMMSFDRSFLISTFMLTFTFFIIVLQFTPVLMMTDKVKLDRIQQLIDTTQLDDLVEGFYGRSQLVTVIPQEEA